MSDTPRTEAAKVLLGTSLNDGSRYVVRTGFARQIERELNEANKVCRLLYDDATAIKTERDQLRAEVERLKEQERQANMLQGFLNKAAAGRDAWRECASMFVPFTREIIIQHQDPNEFGYNGCDKDKCHWCEVMEKALAAFEKLKSKQI